LAVSVGTSGSHFLPRLKSYILRHSFFIMSHISGGKFAKYDSCLSLLTFRTLQAC
jgi:hypothetical protein